MTTLTLSSAGKQFGGPLGQIIGTKVGTMIDNRIFASETKLPTFRGGRISDLTVQTSTYGKMIPVLYGSSRAGGNIIWSRPIRETINTSTNTAGGGKGGGAGKVSQSQSSYNYTITLAIAICEGEIGGIGRVWADAEVVDPYQGVFRLYKGTETQTPDSLIESFEGVGSTPAYRGIAYVVIEDFPLANYGNRIPNFTFEVKKRAINEGSSITPVEDMISAVTLIPGAGEFVYDDTVQTKVPGELVGANWIQQGDKVRINQNNHASKADALVALDQLEATFTNLEWVSVVVVWFADSIDAGSCTIKPGVEYQTGATTEPDIWASGGFTRSTARQILLDGDDNPIYGGTPSDASVLRYIQEIKSRGYNVMFYPMFFVNTATKPWRGRVTGTAAEASNFFTQTNGYNAFVNHYANLVKDDVDAFIIGSELIGLTSVQDVDDSFPAVDELVSLAASVKTTVGSGIKVIYAADWSEYHHTTDGWYNLDPLWASSDIDIIGIDAYFPLSDEPQSGYSVTSLVDGWTSGEGYDWVYTDSSRTTKDMNLQEEYAWKNIQWWWDNEHINPDMATTAWVPQSKKIWFTEYGYPSIDGAANQPNVFYDPNSSESAFPYHSKGRVDFRAQRTALTATETKWADSTMIERMFVWTWDARPFPFWPDLTNVWADGSLWKTGHWVQGKLGISTLAAIVSSLAQRVGLTEEQVDVTDLTQLVEGLILTDQISAREAIDALRQSYFFDAVESGGKIKFIERGGSVAASIAEADLINEGGNALDITREQELDLPKKFDVTYFNKAADYQAGNQHSQRLTTNSVNVATANLPIVMSDQDAKIIADIGLFNIWQERTKFEFSLPVEYAVLEPTDIINVTVGNITYKMRVVNAMFGAPGIVKIKGVAEDISVYDFYNDPGDITPNTKTVEQPGDTTLAILDLPAFPSDYGDQGNLRYALARQEAAWKGAAVFRSDDDGDNYVKVIETANPATLGTATTILAGGPVGVFDEENTVTVTIIGSNTLEGKTEIAVLNGANLAKIGDEIIQFKTATLISDGKYTLGGLLRGRLNTENYISSHIEAEQFILLDNALEKEITPNSMIGLARLYKAVSFGQGLSDASSAAFAYQAVSLKPYSPVHIAGVRDGSGNLTITWIRRTRVNGQWQDNVDVPLGEGSEAYEVDILDGTTIVRTISGLSSATASYAAAEQAADFGSAQSSIDVQVYQLSEIVGRGEAGIASV